MKTKPKHLTKQDRRDIQADHGGYPTMETVTGIRDNAARASWPKRTPCSSTPGPWEVSRCGIKTSILSAEPLNALVAIIPTGARTEANAARIVLCINAHDALVEALHEAKNELEWMEAATGKPCHEQVSLLIRAALAAAKVAP